MNYLNFIKESRYKTHGLNTVKRQLPLFLKSIDCIYDIDYQYDTDDFLLQGTNMTKNGIDALIGRCEILGYYPSVFNVNGENIGKGNIRTIDDFINIIKDYNIEKSDKIWFQFESWLDEEIVIPDKLYHVCRTVNVDKIKRYGLSPKSKHKISYHPDRIYLVEEYLVALNIIKQFKETEDIDYSIITIKPDKDILLLRSDPNFNRGFYTNQNIPPSWIIHIRN